VIAGSLMVISLFVLSWFLMLGCHVGVDNSGFMHLGAGAGVWLCITSCIAFYLGGASAAALSPSYHRNWALGAAVWSLAIPLALVIAGFISGNGELSRLSLPHTNTMNTLASSSLTNNYTGTNNFGFGFVWTTFIALGLGLLTAIMGGISAHPMRKEQVTARP
jgi:hypothetical protein